MSAKICTNICILNFRNSSEKRTNPTPIILSNLNGLQTGIGYVSHTLAKANQSIQGDNTIPNAQDPLMTQQQYHTATEREPKYNKAQVRPTTANKQEFCSCDDEKQYFSNTSSEETCKYDKQPREIFINQEPQTFYRCETEQKFPMNVRSVHKQLEKFGREEPMEYPNGQAQNSFAAQELGHQIFIQTGGTGNGRSSQCGLERHDASTLNESPCRENTLFIHISNTQTSIKSERTQYMNGSQRHSTQRSQTPRSVRSRETHFSRRKVHYTDADESGKYHHLSPSQCCAMLRDPLLTTRLRKQSLPPPTQKSHTENAEAFHPTPTFMMCLQHSSEVHIKQRDSKESAKQEVQKEKLQHVENLIESVKSIGE